MINTNNENKKFNQMMMHKGEKNMSPYVSIDTPNGQFRIYPEMEEGYHGAFITFVRDGQAVESEEYQEDIHFGQYRVPHCPYCGDENVHEVDDFGHEIKFLCKKCSQDFLMDINTGEYYTRNRVPLKPFEEKEKEQG